MTRALALDPQRTFTLFGLVTILLAGGCGGGGPSSPDHPDGPGDGPGTGTITVNQRMAALDAVADKLNSLTGTTPDARRAELLGYLQSRSVFEAAGVNEDGSLWARFDDGRLLLFPIAAEIDGEFEAAGPAWISSVGTGSSPPSRMAPPITEPAAIVVSGPRPRAAGGAAELPDVVQARFLSGGDPPGAASVIPMLEALVTSRGYRLAPGAGTGTIDDLMRVNGDGIFYFGGHGGKGFTSDGGQLHAVTTATVVSAENDLRYLALWRDLSLAYGFPITSLIRPFVSTVGTGTPPSGNRPDDYYGFTKNFVTLHMGTFSDGSLVYIAACSSFDSGFRDAFLAKGVGVYFSWTSVFGVFTDARATAFLFDRMLGTNEAVFGIAKESPDQRPFDYVSVYQNMVGKNLVTFAGATLTYKGGAPESGLLAPSIQYLDVDEEKGQLILTGKFGTDPGEVKIGGVNLPIESWGKEEIKATIPVSGSQSAGEVVVWSKGRKSNTRRLTEWRPTFRLRFAPEGTLKWEGELRVHFRADVSSFRKEAGNQPEYRTVPFHLASDSFGELEASGTSSNGNTKWEGVASISNGIVPGSQNLMVGIGEFDTDSPALRLFLAVVAQEGMEMVDVESGRRFPLVAEWAYGRDNVTLTAPNPALPAMKVALDDDFSIRSDTKREAPPPLPSAIMFWSSYSPVYPPADDLARSPFAFSRSTVQVRRP